MDHKTDTDSERAKFEAWFRREYHGRLDRNMPDRSYNDPHAYTMWIAWQARASLAASAGSEPVVLDHIACIEDGELRYMTGRKAPSYDCELYAMPGGKSVPPLYTHPSPPEGGWISVPVEATLEMALAGVEAFNGRPRGQRVRYVIRNVWTAMLHAAPPASEAKERGNG